MEGLRVDLNADLGEGAGADAALLGIVTSAAVACGFHAGAPLVMLETARRAASLRVTVGAHPSYDDREGFGRRPMNPRSHELVAGLVYQLGAMTAAAAAAGTRMLFVKPHGALYNRAAVDPSVADAVVEAVGLAGAAAADRPPALLCPAGSVLYRRASAAGISAFAEAFADRAYAPDGTLLDRHLPGAVLADAEAVARQAVDLVLHGRVAARDGSVIEVRADSICVHGDTPGAVGLARSIRSALEEAGVSVAPFVAG